MPTLDAPASPDLSHLPDDVRLSIGVEVVRGATWQRVNGTAGWWYLLSRHRAALLTLDETGALIGRALDDCSHPSVWGPILRDERMGLHPHPGRTAWLCTWGNDGGRGPWCPTIHEAVARAFLAKHGHPQP